MLQILSISWSSVSTGVEDPECTSVEGQWSELSCQAMAQTEELSEL